MRRILFLAAKIQEELGRLHVLPDFLLLHAMIAPPLWQGKEGGGYNSSADSSKNLRFLVLPPPKVGIKEPFLPGISHPSSKDRPVPGISKEGAESTELARIKRIGQCRVFQKKGGRINRTRQHQKNRPVPGISKKRGAESKEPAVPVISKLLNQPNLVFIIDLPK
jgi:hypothetical protein